MTSRAGVAALNNVYVLEFLAPARLTVAMLQSEKRLEYAVFHCCLARYTSLRIKSSQSHTLIKKYKILETAEWNVLCRNHATH